MATQNLNEFLDVLERNYKSLEQPDFSFVSSAISSKPYDALIKNLRELFDVEEITDTNDDVSFRYLLSKSSEQWVVELSMLGRYAVILGQHGLVTLSHSTQQEQRILSLLLENQFVVLEQQQLEQPVSITLSNTEPENVCIYQALFSDTDLLPWKG